MSDVTLGIKITADAKGARAEISSLSGDLTKLESSGQKAAGGIDSTAKASDKAARDLRNAGSAVDKARGGFDALGISVARLAGAFTGLSVVGVATYVVKTAAEFDRLNASLRTVTGSVEGQQKAMDMIKSFAAQTPYELQQVTEAFIRLRSLGLEASEKSLRSFGNTASAMGKPLMQFIEAVADASTNEFERLKEFGIKAAQEGDKVTFTFRGVSTTVQKTSEEITKYLQNIGNTEFAGGMAQQMDTLSGKASNLADAFANLAESFANASGLKSGIKGALDEITESVNYLGKSMELAFGAAKNAPVQALELQLQDLQDRLNEMDNLKARGFGGFVDDQIYKQTNEELRKTSELLEKLTVNTKTAGEEFSAVTTKAGNAGQAIESMSRAQIEIMQKVAAEAKRQGVEIAAALAIAEQESSFNQAARAKTKYGDAVGVMQLIPPTAKSLGVDASNLEQNIEGGIRLIKKVEAELVAALGEKGRDIQLVAAAYFTGTKNVVDSIKKNGALPGYSDGNKTVPDYSADIQAKIAKYRGAEKEITAAVDSELKDRQKAYSDHFDAVQTLAKASAKAQETIAKSTLSVEVAILEQQRKAYEEYVRSRSGELTGNAQTQFLEQAAQQEAALIEQSMTLKQRAIATERQATQAELASIQQRIAAKDQLKLSESQVSSLLGEQKQLTADLASLDAQSTAVRIQGSGELQQVMIGVADAYAKQAEAAQQAAAARDDLLSNLDAEIAALERGVKVRGEIAQAEKAAADLSKDAHDAYIKQVDDKLNKIDDLKKANEDRVNQEKAVSDEVVRMQGAYRAMVQQAQNAAQGMSQAFGDTGKAIGNLLVGLAQYQDTMYNLQVETNYLLEQNKKNGGGAAGEMEIRAQAANKELTYQIQNYGNLTQAAQGFFEKGTSGYAAMENATKVFRAVELAMTLANYVQMATAGASYTVQDVAQTGVRTQAKAVEAVANQASGGDPYSAFPRMAAMAAAMAAIGFGVAGAMGGGGGSSGTVAKSKKSEGTVFGDSTAQSNSIRNALEIVAKNSSTDLSYSAAMLRSLQNLESALAGVTNSVIRNVGPAQVSGLGTRQTISWDPFAIFMKTTKAITDWGIGAFPQMLKDILSAGFQGKTFTDITTTTKLFGMTLSQSTKTVLGDMASETEKQFTLAFRSIVDTVREASKAFGTSADQFNQMVETFVVRFDTTSLKGLKGEELENAIQQQFSKIADQIAGALDIQGLDQFQRVGEGMFETLVRVADGINTANAELEALGINAIKYSDITFKQGDVAAEIVRQSIVAFEGINSGIGDFIDQAVGSAEDLIQTYQDLLQSRDILKGLQLGWEDLNRTMTDAAGGVSKFLESLQSFKDNFYNPGEQLAADQVTLAREFGNLGLVLPDSKEAFRALAESIDTSTESGAELFARVIKLSEAFSKASDAADDLERKYKSYTDPFFDFKDRIQTVMDDFESILSGRLGGIEAKFSNQATLAKQQANSPLQDQISQITGALGTRQAEVAQDYAYIAQAQTRIAELQDLINRAMASGNSRLVGYVRAWMSETDDLNAMIGTLNSDIAGKTKDINQLNSSIAELQKQIAQNSADIDAGQLGAKLDELTKERARILRQQGDALVQTMQDVWEQVVGVIDDARRSLARQIAELQGQRALVRNSTLNERDALSDLRAYQRAGGKDPQKTVDLVTTAQDAIMQRYTDRLEVLTKQMEKAARPLAREIRQDYRAQEKEIRVQLRVDTREINRQLRIDTRDVQRDANQRIREIERAGNQAVRAYRKQVDAQIEAINAAEQAATRALEDAQQAQQDALQEQQDAKMEALQDAQQQEQKVLQKQHTAQMKALQDQLSAAQQLEQAYKQLADYANNLMTGGLSSLSPEAKLAEAERQYNELVAKARAGDAEAAGKVSGAADTYLQQKRAYEGSGTAYDAAYQKVLADTQALGGMTAQTDPIQTAIEQLQDSQEKELEALQKSQQAESKALQKVFQTESRALSRSQQDAMSSLQESFQKRIDRLNETAQRVEDKMGRQTEREVARIERQTDRQINQLERAAQRQINHAERLADRQINKLEREQTRAIEALTNPNKNEAIKQLKERTVHKLERLDTVLVNAKEKAAEHARDQIAYLRSLNILNARQLEQLNKIGTATNAGTTAIPAYATGGVLKPGLATVAERGIEPIWFDRGGRVLSNSEARQSLTQSDQRVVSKLEELKGELRAIVRQGAAAYPRMVDGVEKLADTTDKAARLAKSRPVAKA